MIMRGHGNHTVNHYVRVGSTIQLNCGLLDPSGAIVTWVHNGREHLRWRGISRPVLYIRPQDCEGMKFSCWAKNFYGTATRTFVIHVIGKTS